MEVEVFENFGIKSNKEVLATRKQIEELYEVPTMTLSDNIRKLKEDGLVNGTKNRMVAKDGRKREVEVFSLQEVIAIGFRLRSETALRLQYYASELIMEKLKSMEERKRNLELELSFFWNKSDREDIYG